MDIAALRTREQELLSELERSIDDPATFAETETELGTVQRQLREVDASLARIQAAASNPRALIGGDSGNNRGAFEPPMVNRLGGDAFASNIRLDDSMANLRGRLTTGLERDQVTPDYVKEGVLRTLATVEGDRRAAAIRCLVTGSDSYRSAFTKLLSGAMHTWDDQERRAVARAQSLTDAAGGFAVPFTLDPTLVPTGTLSTNPIRRIARTAQTTTDSWNGVTSGAATFSWDAEGAEVSDDSVTLAQPSIPVYKLQGWIPFSLEIGGDWAAIDSDLRMIIAEAKDEAEAAAHLTGSGSGQPTGIVTELAGGSSEIAAITSETFTAADVYNVQRQLPARHRIAGPVWVGNIGTANDIRQFDTAGGGDFWTSLGNGTPERLLGWQFEEASLMDDSPDIDAAATANNYILIVGNWSRYVVVDRIGMAVELVATVFGSNQRPTGQRGLHCWMRGGAESIDDAAFRMLNVSTTA